jgi:hypothetical protein
LAGGRRHNFFPDLPDKDLPCLSTRLGGNGLRRSPPLGGQFCGAGLDLHDVFSKEEVHFCRKEPQGQLARTGREIHHHSSALGHPPAAEIENEIRKDLVK